MDSLIFALVSDNSGLWFEMPNSIMPSPREYTSFNVFQGAGVLFGLLNGRMPISFILKLTP